MPRHGDTVELNKTLRRLEKIMETFPPEGHPESGMNGVNEDFDDLEQAFHQKIEVIREVAKSLNLAHQKSSVKSIADQIRQKRIIYHELEAIGEIMSRMGKLIEKERKRKKKRISDEELKRRETNFQTFALLAQKTRNSLGNEKVRFGDQMPRLDAQPAELLSSATATSSTTASLASRGASIGFGSGAMVDPALTALQQQTLFEIQQKDQEQDHILEEISGFLLQADEIAKSIHDMVTMQGELLENLEKKLDKTQENMERATDRQSKYFKTKRFSAERFCGVFTCMILILGLVGVIVAGI